MKVKKKKLVILVGLVLVVGAGMFLKTKADNEKPKGIMVSTTTLTPKDIEQSITLKAPLEGTESIDVVSILHYEILKINVKEGDRVTKGQVLAVLDSDKLKKEIDTTRDSLELAKYRLNEKLSNANDDYILQKQKLDEKLRSSQIDYNQALKDYEEASRQLENVSQLFEAGVASKEEMKEKENSVVAAQTKLDSFQTVDGVVVADESELRALETASNGISIVNGKAVANSSDLKEIEIAQKELNKKMEDLEDCEVKSTIDGTVTRVYGKVGRFADDIDSDKASPMFVIENMDKLQMTVNVSEYDIAKIKEGQKVQIGAEILGTETVDGIVARISPTGEERNTTNGTVERVIPTQIDVTGQNSNLIAGVTASAKIEIDKSTQAMVVPNQAVLENEEGKSQIYRLTSENKIEILPVELGLDNDLEIEIKNDLLKDGDIIVLNPELTMTEGMLVTPMPAM